MSIADKLTTIAENEPKVHQAGYNKAMSEFWDAVQNYGNRTNYEYAFNYWGGEYIRPKHKIVPTSRTVGMFQGNDRLKKVEKAYFDLSNCSVADISNTAGIYNTFSSCGALEEIEDIGIPAGGYYQTFFGCNNLHTIEVLRFNETSAVHSRTFTGCTSLANITIEGVIGVTINLQWCPLSRDSVTSVVSHLSDNVTGQTLTLNETAVNNAFTADEWTALEGTKTNWTISLI